MTDETAVPVPDPNCVPTVLGRHCPKCNPEPAAAAGVWIVYDWDNGPYIISLHPTCEAAVESTAGTGYGRIGFVAFGVEFPEGLAAWEKRGRATR